MNLRAYLARLRIRARRLVDSLMFANECADNDWPGGITDFGLMLVVSGSFRDVWNALWTSADESWLEK